MLKASEVEEAFAKNSVRGCGNMIFLQYTSNGVDMPFLYHGEVGSAHSVAMYCQDFQVLVADYIL